MQFWIRILAVCAFLFVGADALQTTNSKHKGKKKPEFSQIVAAAAIAYLAGGPNAEMTDLTQAFGGVQVDQDTHEITRKQALRGDYHGRALRELHQQEQQALMDRRPMNIGKAGKHQFDHTQGLRLNQICQRGGKQVRGGAQRVRQKTQGGSSFLQLQPKNKGNSNHQKNGKTNKWGTKGIRGGAQRNPGQKGIRGGTQRKTTRQFRMATKGGANQ